eukprot:gene3295-biopygen11955
MGLDSPGSDKRAVLGVNGCLRWVLEEFRQCALLITHLCCKISIPISYPIGQAPCLLEMFLYVFELRIHT